MSSLIPVTLASSALATSDKSTLYYQKYTTKCDWCNLKEKIGSFKNINNEQLFKKNMRTLVSRALPSLPIGVKLYIYKFLETTSNSVCYECCDFDFKITRSGRKINAPIKFSDIKFVGGSGFGGCDMYDGGYDNGVHHDTEKFLPDGNLDDFVVNEDDIEDEICLSEQEEFDFDDTDSDCSDEEYCRDWE